MIGQIRLAIGQSNLFINERFKQFSGLIDDCVLKRGEKEIKVEDLAGFWDMIYYQVEDLKTKYDQLEAMERNNWVPLEPVADPNGDVASVAVVANGKAPQKPRNIKRAIKTSPPEPNDTSNGHNGAAKKPAVRSNFREFLKNKKKEVSSF